MNGSYSSVLPPLNPSPLPQPPAIPLINNDYCTKGNSFPHQEEMDHYTKLRMYALGEAVNKNYRKHNIN